MSTPHVSPRTKQPDVLDSLERQLAQAESFLREGRPAAALDVIHAAEATIRDERAKDGAR